MAKKSKPAASPQPVTPLAKAHWAMEVGDVRRARSLAQEAAHSGPEAERPEAEKLLKRLQPDPAAMLGVAAVLLLIVIAAWLAILRLR